MIRRLLQQRVALGALTVTTVLAITVAVNSGFVYELFQPDGEMVNARFTDVAQLKSGDPVRVDGVRVGRVDGIELSDDGRTADVRLLVQEEARPLYRDARAALRFRTLLGGSFAVDLDRGTSRAGELGDAAIPAWQTSNQVELEDVVSFAQGSSKQGLRALLREVPEALAVPDDLGAAARGVRDAAPGLETTLSAVRGRGEQDLRMLVRSAERTVRALDTPDDALRTVVRGAARVVATTAARDDELRATLRRGADVQPATLATLERLDTTLRVADPVLDELREPAGDVERTLAELRPTVADAGRLLNEARPLVARLRPAVRDLAVAARSGAPMLRDIRPSVERLEKTILPDLAERDRITRLRTYEMIGPVIASLQSSASTFDTEGHVFRFPALGGQRALADGLPCATRLFDPETRPDQVVACQNLSEALQDYLTLPPLSPTPGAP